MSVKTYRQSRVEMPEALAAALSSDMFDRINLQPIPVRLSESPPGATWSGYCDSPEFAEFGEIVIAADLAEPKICQPSPRRLLGVYLHECSHRLMPEPYLHNATFFALNLMMTLRAGDNLWHTMKLYDLQDEEERLPHALAWAWKMGHEFAERDISIEQAAKEIPERYDKWCQAFQNRPSRQERLKAQQDRCWQFGLAFTTGLALGLVVTVGIVLKIF